MFDEPGYKIGTHAPVQFLSIARPGGAATLFSRFAEPPPDARLAAIGAGVHSPRLGRRGPVSCPPSFLVAAIRVGPRGGSQPPVPAQPDEIWDDIRDELRRETPDFKF